MVDGGHVCAFASVVVLQGQPQNLIGEKKKELGPIKRIIVIGEYGRSIKGSIGQTLQNCYWTFSLSVPQVR